MTRILFFYGDMSDPAQSRRIKDFQTLGHEVRSISLTKNPKHAATGWPDLSLGSIPNGKLVSRAVHLLGALGQASAIRKELSWADIVVARNVDMALLASVCRLFTRRNLPLVYECLDIHSLFTRRGVISHLARWLERRVLRQSELLAVSSPGFLRNYFDTKQKFSGRATILENKLSLQVERRPRSRPRRNGPLRLGWVGAIRCAPSMNVLLETADTLGANVEIRIHGKLHAHALGDPIAAFASRPNVTYCGPYEYPDGLARVYADCDVVWAQDLWQSGANSNWLLPNRLYEASWFGCPSIAVCGTETARAIALNRIGYLVTESTAPALCQLIEHLNSDLLHEKSQEILSLPASQFQYSRTELERLLDVKTSAQISARATQNA